MYNFDFVNDEYLIELFEEILVRQDNNEKITTIALTNKRLLFMDYIAVDNFEVLRITKGINFPKYKDVYYTINLDEIKIIESDKYYKVILFDDTLFEFKNKKLYETLLNTKL